jgi:hypothetical protein
VTFYIALVFAAGAQAQTPADFAYRLPLEAAGDAAFFRVDVPAAVYEGAVRSDLGDLRIFNRDGAAVALAFLPRPTTEREAAPAVTLPLFPLRVDAQRRDLGDLSLSVRRGPAGTTIDLTTRDGQAVAAQRLAGYLVDASEQKDPLTALTLPLPAGSNLTTRVRVDGSDDLVNWRMLAASAPLLDLEYAGRRLSRDRIELAGGPAKYLRLTFDAGQPAPELATARGEFADRTIDMPRQWRDVPGTPDKERSGDYDFDLGGAFPVDRLTLQLPEINTVAPAQLFARASPKDEWRPAGATVFYRLRQDGGDATNPPFAVNGGKARYWKVRIDPKSGGIGDKPPQLSAGWYPQTLIFTARGSGPFELAYGSVQAQPAALPIETLVPGYDRLTVVPARFPLAQPGVPNVAPAMAALRQPMDLKRWLLWGSLALATVVLGWMALRLSREMGLAPTSPADAAAPPGADPTTENRNA